MRDFRFNAAAGLFSLLLAGATVTAAEPPQAPPASVPVQAAARVEQGYAKKYPGQISAFQDVQIIPRITGIIQKKHFQDGAIVKEGDLLFEFEDVTYKAKVDSARSEVAQLKAELTFTQRNYERNKKLSQSHAVSQSTLDEAEERLETVKAKLLGAEAALRDAENTLSYTKVYAPLTGRAGKTALSSGNLLTPSTGTLVTISMVAPVYMIFSVGEKVFRSEFGGRDGFAKKALIKVELADGTLYEEEGNVYIIDSKVDTVTNTIKIWCTFKNADEKLIPGSYVTVRLGTRDSSDLAGVLPSALQVDGEGTYVYVIGEGGIPERRAVEPGNVNNDVLEIRKGLKPGEKVVVGGMHKIIPGKAVNSLPCSK